MSFQSKFSAFIISLSLILITAPSLFAQNSTEITFWETVRDNGSPEMIQLYLDKYPQGDFADLAKMMLKQQGVKTQAANHKGKQTDQALSKTDLALRAVAECNRLATHRLEKNIKIEPTSMEVLKANSAEAIKSCRQAVKYRGSGRDHYHLYRAYVAIEDYTSALPQLEAAAQLGLPLAQYWLAENYIGGYIGITKDRRKGLELHRQYAKAGNSLSAAAAGVTMYQDAKTDDDYEAALPFLRQGEKAGEPDVYFPLGYMSKTGKGLERDLLKGHDYYIKAIQNKGYGFKTAAKNLANRAILCLENDGIIHGTINEIVTIKELQETTKVFNSYRHSEEDDDRYIKLLLMSYFRLSLFNAEQTLGYSYTAEDRKITRELINNAKRKLPALLLKRQENKRKTSPTVSPMTKADFSSQLTEVIDKLEPYMLKYSKRRDTEEAIKAIAPNEKPVRIASKYCVQRDGEWNSGIFTITVKNKCSLPIYIQVDGSITQGSRTFDQVNKTVQLAGGQRKAFSLSRSGVSGKLTGHASSIACFVAQGKPKSDEQGYYSCDDDSFDFDQHMLEKLELGGIIKRETAQLMKLGI